MYFVVNYQRFIALTLHSDKAILLKYPLMYACIYVCVCIGVCMYVYNYLYWMSLNNIYY